MLLNFHQQTPMYDLFEFGFSATHTATLSVTGVGVGLEFTDQFGSQKNSYSRTVTMANSVKVRARNPAKITRVEWSEKFLIGQLKQSAFNLLVNVTFLALYGNTGLTGALPDVSHIPWLTDYRFRTCGFTSMPPSFARNQVLSILSVQVNQIAGILPDISTNTALTIIQTQQNLMSGNIPSVGHCPLLTLAWFDTNQFTGFSGSVMPAALGNFRASNNLLPASAINAILAAFVAGGRNTGTRDLQIGGTGNAAPTGQGITDKATLVSRGWTVVTN